MDCLHECIIATLNSQVCTKASKQITQLKVTAAARTKGIYNLNYKQ